MTFGFLFLLLPLSASAELPAGSAHLKQTSLSVEVLPVELDVIPIGATRVKLLPLVFRAGCDGDVEIRYIRIKRIGMGDSADIEGAYLLNGDRRLTRSGRFSGSGQTVLLRLQNFIVPACKTVQLDVGVDIKRGAKIGSLFALSVEDASSLVTSANTLRADFPLRTAPPAPSVTPRAEGEIVITFLPVREKVSAIRDETFAKFSLRAIGGAHQVFYGITLTNKGSAGNEDLQNLYLTRRGGRAITPIVKTMEGDSVTFKLSQPYFIRQNQTISFELHGQAYAASKTVNFVLEEPADLISQPTRRAGQTTRDEARKSRL